MRVSIKDMSNIMDPGTATGENKEFLDLVGHAHTLSLDLSARIGHQIILGVVPANEKRYVLKEFAFFIVADGCHELAPSLELILTVVDGNNERMSFSYPYISCIDSNLAGDGIRYYIYVKNRVFDQFFRHDGEFKTFMSAELQEFIKEYRETACRIILLDQNNQR